MAAKLRHLLLVTLENTADSLAWSGSAMGIRRALEGAVERVTVLDNLRVKKHPLHAALRLALGTAQAGNQRAPRYPLWTTKPALRQFARETAQAIERERPDAVVCISSQCAVYLREACGGTLPVPVFLFSDSPWMAWLELYAGYYPWPLTAPLFAARERKAARDATGLIYGSEWARQDAIERFGVPRDKVHVQPLGAGWVPEQSESEIAAAVKARPRDRVELVFLAKEWERKGGPLALSIARGLAESGRVGEVRLNIVGVRPQLPPEDMPLVRMFGMLRRSDPQEAAKLRELLLSSHFLVVPTVAECFGLVFAEAQAFALPPVSRAVHAVPSVVLDGQTGILQPAEDGPAPYIRRILDLLAGDRAAYERTAMAGRNHFLERLNWNAFGQGVARIVEAALQ